VGAQGIFLIEVQGLSVSYCLADGTKIRAVEGLDFVCSPGETVGILGESGCGKSTLAQAILQLLPPRACCEQGTVFFRGRDLLTLSESDLRELRGRHIALVPQDPALSLNPVMTVATQIEEVLRAHVTMRKSERRARVLELLGEVGFDCPQSICGTYPHQLSGGQRQRITIAQAIACNPALIIADEPTSKLDAPLQAEIVTLLAQVRRKHGIAMLVISHDPTLFAGFVDRIAVMYAGSVIETGSASQVLGEPLHPYTQALLRIAKSAVVTTVPGSRSRVAAIEGESPNPAAFPHGCRFHPRCLDRMELCSQRIPQAFLPSPSRPVRCFKYGE
jgi:oligopeptide/dipeptide ABC transporter ATP-binding protein